jgi:hypothetical protein
MAHNIPAHRPYLKVGFNEEEDLISPAGRQPTFELRRRLLEDGFERHAIFLLDGARLSLDKLEARPSNVPPDKRAAVVSFSQVCRAAEHSDPDKSKYLAARVALRDGAIEGTKPTEKPWYFIPPIEKKPVEAPSQRREGSIPMARAAYLSYQLKGPRFSFSDEGVQAKSPIIFQNVKRDLIVEIGNASIEDILELNAGKTEEEDPHFELLYKLLNEKEIVEDKNRPRDAPLPKHRGPLHIPYADSADKKPGGSNCPPVTLP